jgi:hypothetical protein
MRIFTRYQVNLLMLESIVIHVICQEIIDTKYIKYLNKVALCMYRLMDGIFTKSR